MFFLIQKHQKKIQILEERLKRQEDMFEARISHEEKEKIKVQSLCGYVAPLISPFISHRCLKI